MICPQCGAKQPSSSPRMSPASETAAPEWHDGFARHARTEWNPSAFSFSGGVPRDSDYEPRDETPRAPRSWTPFYAIGSVVSIAFLLTAYMISHRTEREPTLGAQIVEGAILGPKATSTAHDTKPHTARSAPPAAVAQLPPPVASAPSAPVASAPPPAVANVMPPPVNTAPPPVVAHVAPAPQLTPAQAQPPRTATVRAETVPPSVAARKSAAADRALAAAKVKADKANAEKVAAAKANAEKVAAAKTAADSRADVSRDLASARASLDRNSLGPARSAINSALTAQPGNGSALQMQAELTSREDQRDSLLGYARLCARDGRWVCAWHNAGHALTVDSSSGEAREILSRSIAAQGARNMAQGAGPPAATMRQVDSGPPGPPIDPN
ncbi:hypothetical protein M3I53_04945 [Paraburkholderia sp. CNPSo 3272]|uniref:hypothetical protein n=1 Tax=Paraburkholderia sp. CNPSo 3272 TaxID=2940931 RepID=UPI0020B8B68F|nr:hypothetical protein [Paraburkholderia sp. CNPSo 3272]MCP3722486.1 hypothetical protein [Paraburkholderia sp. CNPSo 3272]